MIKSIGIVLAFCIAVLVSCDNKPNETPPAKVIPVEVVPVRQGTVAKELKFTGDIEANTVVHVYPKITAKIEEMKVDEGDSVSKGDVIAVLESDELQAQLAQAEAALEAVRARWTQMKVGARPEELAQAEDLVAKARARLKDTENNYQRMKVLYQRGTVARRQFEEAELAYTVAKAELNSAEERLEMLREGATSEERQALRAQVNQAEAALELARIRFSYARVTAPIGGTVSERFFDQGNLAVPAKALVTIMQMDTVRVIIYFPEDQIRYMAPGIGAQLTVAAYPDAVFSGRLDKLSPALNPDTRMFSAEIQVPNKEGLLRPGMFARVRLSVDPHPDALLVPKEAVLYREEYLGNAGSTKGKVQRNYYLFVVDQGRARMQPVLLGHESGTAVEVSHGLQGGERVVIRGMHQLKDGDRVNVTEREGSGA